MCIYYCQCYEYMIRNIYNQYTVADFLNDEEFVAWVKYPTAERDAYWEKVITTYPQKDSQVQQARELILLLNSIPKPATAESHGRVWENIAAGMQEARVRRISPWRMGAVAASVLVLVSAGLFLLQPAPQKPALPPAVEARDVAPGKNVAMLTLANGRQLLLDDSADGLLAKEGGTNIRKTANGQLIYDNEGSGSKTVHVNRIDIPRGGQYRLTLPDGTEVWLNAATSLQYPSSFTGKDRTVQLNGEAYFEVTQNTEMPFRVVSAGQVVEVLGTRFNVNCYEEEDAVRTTLLDGRVRLTNERQASRILSPGEQCTLFPTGRIQIRSADVEEVMAWKEGYFIWNNEPLESIMRKLARWYNIEPEYEKPLPAIALSGIVSRSKNLSEVLKDMETTGSVHFRITDDGKVIVSR